MHNIISINGGKEISSSRAMIPPVIAPMIFGLPRITGADVDSLSIKTKIYIYASISNCIDYNRQCSYVIPSHVAGSDNPHGCTVCIDILHLCPGTGCLHVKELSVVFVFGGHLPQFKMETL